jgi:hypothetical protein
MLAAVPKVIPPTRAAMGEVTPWSVVVGLALGRTVAPRLERRRFRLGHEG